MTFYKKQKNSGFTLVELLVSIAIFSVVMVVCMGSILVMLDSNRKSQAERTVMDNLSYTMDEMVRTVRFGTIYHCGAGTLSQPQDCGAPGDTSMTVLDSSGTRVTYKLSGGRIVETVGGADYFLTSSDTTIQTMLFLVSGSASYANVNLSQPRAIIFIKGLAGVNGSSQSPFSLQTTVSQRKLDL